MSSIWTVRRSATDTKVAGVCAGVAHHWGIDPVLVRLGCALLALSGGVGVVLYAAGWLLIPVEGRDTAAIDELSGRRRWSREVWLVLVVLACIATFTAFSSMSPFGLGPALVIAAIWYFGVHQNRARGLRRSGTEQADQHPVEQSSVVPPPPSAPATPFRVAAEAWQHRVDEVTEVRPGTTPAAPGSDGWPLAQSESESEFFGHPDPVGLYSEPAPVVVPLTHPGRTRSARRLRSATVVLVGLALTSLAFADRAGIAIPFLAWVGVPLLLIGLALIAATWLGRARGLASTALLLGVVVLASVVSSAPIHDWGHETVVQYTRVAALPTAGDRWDYGQRTVDLSQLRMTEDTTYSAHIDAGQLRVVVPSDVNVVGNYAVDFGGVSSYGDTIAGGSVSGQLPDSAPVRPGRPTLLLDLSVDVGQLEVTR